MYHYSFVYHLSSGELFAVCPVDSFPGLAVEPVSDSSRYFVLRLKDPSGICSPSISSLCYLSHYCLFIIFLYSLCSGRHAFVGLGFQDRGDAFDFNVSLMEHFK